MQIRCVKAITSTCIVSSIGQIGSAQGNREYAERNRIEHKTNITMCFNLFYVFQTTRLITTFKTYIK